MKNTRPFLFTVLIASASAADDPLASSNVTWTEFARDSRDSMPLGNGDIGLNVWTESNGDVLFYVGKTDSWDEAPSSGLAKVGRVRVSLSPNPFTEGNFSQALKLREGEIDITGGGASIRLWVDANAPVIRVETKSESQLTTIVTLDPWRTEKKDRVSADVVLPGEKDRITWYHRNQGKPINPELLDRTFGAEIRGPGLRRAEGNALRSTAPATSSLVSVYPLTTETAPLDEWTAKINEQADSLEKQDLAKALTSHRKWWSDFWARSHIFLSGDSDAQRVTQGYTLQRFITACGGRGAYPIKFNGSIFVADNPTNTRREKGSNVDIPAPMTADDRAWGGQYWFQNTRPMYWPRLSAGDFDLMLPLFRMYRAMLPRNAAQVKEFYVHEGAYFRETAPFWGGLSKRLPTDKGSYTDHYYLPIIELSAMMLDYYEYTGDKDFAREYLLPVVTAGLTFYDQHFSRGPDGKILLDPVNSIEMFWKVRNPTPDLAAFHFLLPRLLDLPKDLADEKPRAQWQRLLREMPPVPIGEKSGKRVILPYSGEQTAAAQNSEVPELYAVYPFRLYGVGKPDLQVVLDTFAQRAIKRTKCWHQDPVWAAYLGLAADAKRDVTANLTNSSPDLRFPAFWERGHDYMPDQDNGGNGELALQRMLIQAEGRKILILPAWPKEWNADFKLHAPLNTTVSGRVENGRLVALTIAPSSRRADIVVQPPFSLPTQ
jgi:alpha-L-fucosidase 2